MTGLTVVGGVYGERCAWPHWDQVYGSGGRAAAAVAEIVPAVVLRSYADDGLARHFEAFAEMYGFAFHPAEAPGRITFDYVHPMSVPIIRPGLTRIARLPPIEVEADVVLRFGMLEGSAKVSADRCVYDPQSAFVPERFSANGSRARHLAIVANHSQVLALGGGSEMIHAARSLISDQGAEVVVVKSGPMGAFVVTPDEVHHIPAFRSAGAFTIGSGDVFAALFAASWGVHGATAAEAARTASVAVSEYTVGGALPARSLSSLAQATPLEMQAQGGEVYLAGPFFNMSQRWLIEEAVRCLSQVGMSVFSPFHEIGPGPAEAVAPADIEALARCDVVFAILDGLDSGTIFEVGYARALGKPVYAFAQTVAEEDLKMIVGSGCSVYSDFTMAIHRLAWRA